ncbi:hypothetical protein BCL90_1725 [Pedobacter alluvionis]|uniref:Uncharacterized protein n=1 Tax=Pedobacter alluvionis TaxID=475253 RepID=A0A497Y1Q3_9SPHI|nr:hypothetical protein BCL90_1725 [Pedobacter alluvionis]
MSSLRSVIFVPRNDDLSIGAVNGSGVEASIAKSVFMFPWKELRR